MKIDDVLTLPKLGKKFRRKMRGGKTEKRVQVEGDKIMGKGFHAGYSDRAQSAEKEQDSWHGDYSADI